MKNWQFLLSIFVGIASDIAFYSQTTNLLLSISGGNFIGESLAYGFGILVGLPFFCFTAYSWDVFVNNRRSIFSSVKNTAINDPQSVQSPNIPSMPVSPVVASQILSGQQGIAQNPQGNPQNSTDPQVLAVLNKMTKALEKANKKIDYLESIPGIRPYIEKAGDGFPKRGFKVKDVPTTEELFKQSGRKMPTRQQNISKELDLEGSPGIG